MKYVCFYIEDHAHATLRLLLIVPAVTDPVAASVLFLSVPVLCCAVYGWVYCMLLPGTCAYHVQKRNRRPWKKHTRVLDGDGLPVIHSLPVTTPPQRRACSI